MKISQLFNITKSKAANISSFLDGVECTFAVLIIILFSPIYILNTLISFEKLSAPLSRCTTNDLLGNSYHYYSFNHGTFRHVFILLLIVKREMTWVGLPREVTSNLCLTCFNEMKVGLVSLYGLHQFTGISISNVEEDTLLQSKFSRLEKFNLLVRTLVASLTFRNKIQDIKASFRIFGVRIDNVSLDNAVTKILTPSSNLCTQTACFVNVNSINLASDNNALISTINNFDFAFADGSGMRLAAQMQGDQLLANVNGTDMLPMLCERARSNNQNLYLLGSDPDVASITAANLQQKYPGLRIAGTHHGYFDKQDSQEVICKINAAKTDILLVALGSPIQEYWLQENKSKLNVNTAVAVGGLFDFYSGRISRAPMWMRELGVEWVWRLIKEPKSKFKRYVIGNPMFLIRCFIKS